MDLRPGLFLAALLTLPTAMPAADGKKLFRDHCAGCHGADARGSGKAPGQRVPECRWSLGRRW